MKILKKYKTKINNIPVILYNVPYVEKWGSLEIEFNFHSKKLQEKLKNFNKNQDKPIEIDVSKEKF